MALLRQRSAMRTTRALLSTSAKALGTSFDVAAMQLSPTGQPYRVVFGANAARDHLGAIAKRSGIRKMLVVRDKDIGAASRTQYVEFLLLQAGIPCFQYTLKRDCTTLEGLDDAHATAQRVGADGVLAFGGGNTMDMARGVALMIANGGEAADYVRVRPLVLGSCSMSASLCSPLLLLNTLARRTAATTRSSHQRRTFCSQRSLALAQRSRPSRSCSTKTLRQRRRLSRRRSPQRYDGALSLSLLP